MNWTPETIERAKEAAPELYEVLEMVVKAQGCADPADRLACLAVAAEEAKAALAKARGEV